MSWRRRAIPHEQGHIHNPPRIKSFLTILMFIGCLSATAPTTAGEMPAQGGYTATGKTGTTGYFDTEIEAINNARWIVEGCFYNPYPYSGVTVCWDPYEILETPPWSFDSVNFWQWWRVVYVRMPIRRYPDSGGSSIEYDYEYMRVVLRYYCPSGYRLVEDGSTYQIGSPRPTCTDGLPSGPPSPGGPPSPCQSNHSIRLQGPGGTAGALADVEPGASVNALSARVTCDGQPVSGKAVALNIDVVSLSGGHQHDQGRRPQHSGTVSFNGSDTTDANGDVAFTFTAPAPAGDHTITARCTDGSCGTDTGSVWVGIQGLQPIGSGPWRLTGARPEHPDNHYLTVPAFLVLQQLGLQWRRFYVPFGPVFTVNDASLARGGLFDCCETYTDERGITHNRQIEGWWTPPHDEHRRGTVVDINGIRREDERRFESEAADLDAVARIHGTGTGRHYHVRLRGVAE